MSACIIPPVQRIFEMAVGGIGILSLLLLSVVPIGGCVRRTITITSTPPNALVWLNGREIGRTPVEVDFLYYGMYDVQLVADGQEPLITSGEAKPPLWDSIPFDFIAEVLPGERTAKVAWHYDLQPRNDDPAALIERARQMRERLPAPSMQPAETQPSSTNPSAAQ